MNTQRLPTSCVLPPYSNPCFSEQPYLLSNLDNTSPRHHSQQLFHHICNYMQEVTIFFKTLCEFASNYLTCYHSDHWVTTIYNLSVLQTNMFQQCSCSSLPLDLHNTPSSLGCSHIVFYLFREIFSNPLSLTISLFYFHATATPMVNLSYLLT